MVTAQPSGQVLLRGATTLLVDLFGVGVIDGELQEEAVRVGDVERHAIAVVEDERVGFVVAGLIDPFLDAVLGRLVDGEGDVAKRA